LAVWLAPLVALIMLMPLRADASTLLFDDYNNSNLATNTAPGGVGTGFETKANNGTPSEPAGTNARYQITSANTGYQATISKDPLDPVDTTVTWTFTSWTNPGGRAYAYWSREAAAAWHPGQGISGGPGSDQILILMNGSGRGNNLVFYVYDAGVQTTFNTIANLSSLINFASSWDVILSVTSTGYDFSLVQVSSTGVPSVTGNWSDQGKTLASVLDVNGEMRVGAAMQGQFSGTSTLLLDSVEVTSADLSPSREPSC
jgi:hypothetical protein